MKKSDIFLTGFIVGSITALLVTSKTGPQRRKELAECSAKLNENAVNGINKIKNSELYNTLTK